MEEEIEGLGLADETGIAADSEAETTDANCSGPVPGGMRRKSRWRRFSQKCKCDRNSVLLCDGQENGCPPPTRYYRPDINTSMGCRCVPNICNLNCSELVVNGTKRKSAWRRSQKCKCPKAADGVTQVVRGRNPICNQEPPTRYYDMTS